MKSGRWSRARSQRGGGWSWSARSIPSGAASVASGRRRPRHHRPPARYVAHGCLDEGRDGDGRGSASTDRRARARPAAASGGRWTRRRGCSRRCSRRPSSWRGDAPAQDPAPSHRSGAPARPSACWKGSKIASTSSRLIPMPVSRIGKINPRDAGVIKGRDGQAHLPVARELKGIAARRLDRHWRSLSASPTMIPI